MSLRIVISNEQGEVYNVLVEDADTFTDRPGTLGHLQFWEGDDGGLTLLSEAVEAARKQDARR